MQIYQHCINQKSPRVHSKSPAWRSATEFEHYRRTFTYWGVRRAWAPPRHGPCGGFSLVIEACVVFSASPPALTSRGLLCVKCWRWLIFVFPPLWERKTQLIHCDPSVIPSGSSQSLRFLPSSFGFFFTFEGAYPVLTLMSDVRITQNPGYLMLTSSVELSHDDKFLYGGQWDFICRIRPPWNGAYKYCCQDRWC